MNKIIIGVDPDSDKHGISVYNEGKLDGLTVMNNLQMYLWIKSLLLTSKKEEIEFHIENVCANKATFYKIGISNETAKQAVTRGVGKCQQAQVELERVVEHFGIKIVHHKISSMWKDKKGKKQFERATGWKGRSNEDNRSAAYFGWLGSN